MFILPTHSCFDDAAELCLKFIESNKYDPAILRIVHGKCTLENGEPYAHAWLEYGKACYFVGIINGEKHIVSIPRSVYYKKVGMQSCTRYSLFTAVEHTKRTGSSGPWIPTYKVLCRSV